MNDGSERQGIPGFFVDEAAAGRESNDPRYRCGEQESAGRRRGWLTWISTGTKATELA
jgi:hypothetical protein